MTIESIPVPETIVKSALGIVDDNNIKDVTIEDNVVYFHVLKDMKVDHEVNETS